MSIISKKIVNKLIDFFSMVGAMKFLLFMVVIMVAYVTLKLPSVILGNITDKSLDALILIIKKPNTYSIIMTSAFIVSFAINVIQKNIYIKEIDRLAKIRADLIHNIENGEHKTIIRHRSSKRHNDKQKQNKKRKK